MSTTSRRSFLTAAVAGMASSHSFAQTIRQAPATPANNATGTLADIEHVVILMQENRSFDHYFGTLSGVRGFSDPDVPQNSNGTPIFDQYGFQPGTGPSSTGYMQPFRLLKNPPSETGADSNGIAPSW